MKCSVIGNVALETKLLVDSFPCIEGETTVRRMLLNVGGSGACFAAVLARLGCNVRLLSHIGEDSEGEQALGVLASAGVDISVVQVGGPTSHFYSVFDSNWERQLFIRAAPWSEAVILEQWALEVQQADILVVCPTTEALFKESLNMANDSPAKVIVLPQGFVGPSSTGLIGSLSGAYALVMNHMEAFRLSDGTGETWIPQLRAQLGVDTLLVTQGKDGCRYATANEYGSVPGLHVPVVDPSGAGDSLAAGFTWAALIEELPIRDAVAFGCACGAAAVASKDLVGTGFERDDVKQLLSMYRR